MALALVTGALLLAAAAPALARPSWLAPTDLSDGTQNASHPQIAIDPQGEAVAIWRHENANGNLQIESSSRPAGGSWSEPPSVLSDGTQTAEDPQIALDSAGDAVAVWERFNGTKEVVQTAAFDASPPKLEGLRVPSKGQVGLPVLVSFSAQDAFSALGQSSWDFGDGVTTANATATHTYAKPGSYQITLHLTDALANATQATQTITIAPKPAPSLALASHLVKVKAAKALLFLRCPKTSTSPCQGLAKLAALRGKPKQLGQGRFQIAAGKQATLKLSTAARQLLSTAGPKGLGAKLSGTGVKATTLRLRALGGQRGSRR